MLLSAENGLPGIKTLIEVKELFQKDMHFMNKLKPSIEKISFIS